MDPKARRGMQIFTVTSKEDAALNSRVFIGNLPTDRMDGPKELQEMFSKYGPVHDAAVHKGFGFVQFGNEQDARKAVQAEGGGLYKGLRLDVKMAAEGRNKKPEERDRSPLTRGAGGDGASPSGSFNEPCRYYRMGNCTRGSSCFYRHEEPNGDRPAPPPRVPVGRDLRDRGSEREGPLRERDPFRERVPSAIPRERESMQIGDTRELRPHPRDREGFAEEYLQRPLVPPFDPYAEPSFEQESFGGNGFNGSYNAPAEEIRREYPPVTKPSVAAFAKPPFDCLLVACHQQQRGYCEMIERRLRSLNLHTGVQVPKDKEGVQEALEEATKRGVPYAIIVTSQNEVHRSLTLNILHGTPQEHRNMPLEDALSLVGRTYDEYVDSMRQKQLAATTPQRAADTVEAPVVTGTVPPPDGNLAYLLNLIADGRELTLGELEMVLAYVQKRKDRAAALADPAPPSSDPRRPRVPEREVPQLSSSAGDRLQAGSRGRGPPSASPSATPTPGGGNTSTPVGAGQRGQQQNQMGPPRGNSGYGGATGGNMMGGGGQAAGAAGPSAMGTINFDNPLVQRALDNLASGPAMMQKPKIQPLVPGIGDRGGSQSYNRGYNNYY